MKKLSKFVLVAGVSVAGFVACGGDDNNASSSPVTVDMSTAIVDMNASGMDMGATLPDMPTSVADMPAPEDMPQDMPQVVTQEDMGVDAGGEGCSADYECLTGQVCDRELGACLDTCVNDNDCFRGEECVPRPGDASTRVCRVKEPGDACVDNDECVNTEGVEGVCFQGECDYPVEPSGSYQWLMVLDESAGDEACDQTDPGSDIMGARLLDGTGQLLGWGDAGNDVQGFSGNETNRYDTAARLDGTSHGFEGRSCPDAGSRLSELTPPPLSLGCGGWVMLRFIDSMGNRVDITDGLRIEVLEYGPTCGGSNADSYSIYLCTDSVGAQGGDDTSCTFGVGGVQGGFSSVDVSL